MTVTPLAAGAPDGTTTATRLAPTATSGIHSTFRILSVVVGATYCFSCWVRADGYTKAALRLGGNTAVGAVFDLAAGIVLQTFGAVPTTAGMIDSGGGWWRCWLVTTTIGGTYAPNLMPVADSYTIDSAVQIPNYTGDPTRGVVVWGGQVELGPEPSSHIAATGAPATRPADLITMPLPTGPTAGGGALLVEWEAATAALPAAAQPWLAGLSTGAAADSLALAIQGADAPDTISADVTVAGVQRFGAGLGEMVRGAVQRAGMTWRDGIVSAMRNGGAVQTGAAAALPPTPTQLALGHRAGTTDAAALWLRRVRLFAQPLTEARLRSLTM